MAKKKKQRLRVKREAIRVLAANDLARAGGGAPGDIARADGRIHCCSAYTTTVGPSTIPSLLG